LSRHLVAINHDDLDKREKDSVMSPKCLEAFRTHVDPLITGRSLVLCEGLNYRELIPPYHGGYEFVWKRFLNAATTRLPTIGGCDFRQEQPLPDIQRLAQRYDDWVALTWKLVSATLETPSNLAEGVEMLRKKIPSAHLTREPTPDEVQLATFVREMALKFDREYLVAIRKYSHQFDRIFLVAGSVHCLALALKAKYPLIDITEAKYSRASYRAYLAIYHWPLLLKRP
jgi:hypothetical protein